MGCCTSNLHASRPIKSNMSRKSQDHLEEETKNPDYYRKHSEVVELDMGPHEPAKNQVFPPGPGVVEQKKNFEASLPRSEQEFNLNKDLMESIRRDWTLRKETASQDMDISIYKITKEQHDMILRLVTEVSAIIDADLARLHDYLAYFSFEYDELHVSIEQLRNNNKDLENCLDDLKAHPVPNERDFYYLSERKCRLIKNIVWEYNKFKQGTPNCDYTTFKETALDLIRRFNSNSPDDRLDNNFAKPQKEVKNDEIVRTKETAMTSQRGAAVTDRTEVPTYAFPQGNWSQSEGSGDPICETDRGYEKKNSIEKLQIERNLESSTIFKKDKNDSDDVQKKAEVRLLDFPSLDQLHHAQQTYKEQKESIFDVFPRRVKNYRKGGNEVEYVRRESNIVDHTDREQNDAENIDVYLKEDGPSQRLDTKESNSPGRKGKMSGHLAMVMKLKRLNQQRQEELKTEGKYSERRAV